MKVYLDNCCFNRPFDDQSALIVRLETEAVLLIQQLIRDGKLKLVWSFMIDYENAANPFIEKRSRVNAWRSMADENIQHSFHIAKKAAECMYLGFREKDAVHIACAFDAKADYFITTDKKILNKSVDGVEFLNPIEFLRRYDDVK
ncbi:MAG: PIN domain-containing protein [Clostridiales bacterium]|jgi:predicted nucleic acid-binding protein|nr:PIN domain-containing protein [Clostridiales bacterium]